MFNNYLKIALRNLWKQKIYAVINVVGLAVGIAFCALIFLYVRDEMTYDRFHEDADRIYRMHRVSFAADGSVRATDTSLPFPTGPAMMADLPEIEQYVRFFRSDHFVRQGEQAFEEEVLYTDPQFLSLFSFPLLQGDASTALANPNNVVITEEMAGKYFGDIDPMGQQLFLRISEEEYAFTVAGVAQEVPGNSSIQFEVLVPIQKLMETVGYFRERMDSWQSSAFKTYVLLREGTSIDAARAKLPDFRTTYYPDEEADLRERGLWTGEGMPTSYDLQPMTAIHLTPEIRSYSEASSPMYSYILSAIALAVLLIACINFMTLSIGRSAKRAREIGVRKVVGANRMQVMLQFWGEALLMSLFALGVGLALAEFFLPVFNNLAAKTLHLDFIRDAGLLAMLLGVTLVTGLIAGSYPALVLSGFQPVEALKNRLRLNGSNAFTQSLVVVQFALSVFLICGTLIMLSQLDYLRTKNLGFDKEHVVVIETSGTDGALALDRYRSELGSRNDIAGLTGVSYAFAKGVSRVGFEYEGALMQVAEYIVESDYVDVLGMELVAGRNFDPRLATDSSQAIIVNETLVRDFGWTDPIGQSLTGLTESSATDPIVIGVVKDFNFKSLHEQIEPMMLTLGPKRGIRTILARIHPDNVPATLDVLRSTWQAIAPDVPFQYSFLDDDLDQQYRAEERWSQIVGYGAGFAILIACLGLFGLAALTVAGRTKEIGIRKVLGATLANIAVLLSKDFAKLVLIALVIAAPAAYFALRAWLDNFAYRIEISATIFLMAGSLALAIALATVSYHAIRAALADPVKSLRYE